MGNPNRYAVKPMTVANPNGAPAEDDQKRNQQEIFFHLSFPLLGWNIGPAYPRIESFNQLNPFPLID